MMHNFLTNNRDELITRCRDKVAQRPHRQASADQLRAGVPMFLDQLIRTLRAEQSDDPEKNQKFSGPERASASARPEIGVSATMHGCDLIALGFSVDEVVHDYGDLCQSITDLAFERDSPFEVDEFRTLNRCLDNAIADAVAEFTYQRDFVVADKQALEMNERLGFLAHELRNALGNATMAYTAMKAGNMVVGGATGAVLERSLVALRRLIDRSLAEVRITAGNPALHEVFSLANFITEVKNTATLEARVRGCLLTVRSVDPLLAIDVDRDLIAAALGNLLQNAFKYTHHHTEVTLNAYASGDRVLIDVVDHCGGLAHGDAQAMFSPFSQRGEDKTGLGLGLSIARKSVEANGGSLTVRDDPGTGCVFTISLPRSTLNNKASLPAALLNV
jgi:signal transduction histidine kinase